MVNRRKDVPVRKQCSLARGDRWITLRESNFLPCVRGHTLSIIENISTRAAKSSKRKKTWVNIISEKSNFDNRVVSIQTKNKHRSDFTSDPTLGITHTSRSIELTIR